MSKTLKLSTRKNGHRRSILLILGCVLLAGAYVVISSIFNETDTIHQISDVVFLPVGFVLVSLIGQKVNKSFGKKKTIG